MTFLACEHIKHGFGQKRTNTSGHVTTEDVETPTLAILEKKNEKEGLEKSPRTQKRGPLQGKTQKTFIQVDARQSGALLKYE